MELSATFVRCGEIRWKCVPDTVSIVLNVKCSTVDQTCWTRRSDESVDLIFDEQSDDIPSSYLAAAARIQWHETKRNTNAAARLRLMLFLKYKILIFSPYSVISLILGYNLLPSGWIMKKVKAIFVKWRPSWTPPWILQCSRVTKVHPADSKNGPRGLNITIEKKVGLTFPGINPHFCRTS